jgi:predicted nuclease with TOPRIM domain
MHVLIDNLRKKLAEKKENLLKLRAGKNDIIQFNEIQMDALKADFNDEIEKLNKQTSQLNEEKKRLVEKCSNLEEHIQILESTVRSKFILETFDSNLL